MAVFRIFTEILRIPRVGHTGLSTYSVLLVVLLSLLFPSAALSEGGLDPHLLQGIYAGKSGTEVEKVTLEHLQTAFKKLYDVDLPVIQSRGAIKEGRPVVVLGREAVLETGCLSAEELLQVSPGGHIIRSSEVSLVIVGSTGWDTRYGVYHFLEMLGVRFFLPRFDQALYPDIALQRIPAIDLADRPDFAYRSGRSDVWRQMYYQLGDPHKGLDSELFDREATGSDLWIDHTAGYLVPKLLYYEKHPEYYALIKSGERVSSDKFTDHRTPLCLSNPDVIRISSERALGWVGNEPDKSFFMITYGDTNIWCQCEQCRKLDVRGDNYSDRLLHWANPIAKEVGEKYPEKIFMTFAYGGTDNPPLKHTPEDNLWVVGSTGLGNFPFWEHSRGQNKIAEKHFDKIDGWLKVVPDRYTVCEYQSGTYKPALIDTMQARLRYYREKGLRGIVFTYGNPRNFATLWRYMLGRLMWQVDQDAMKTAQEFVAYYYGAAADEIWNILELGHKRYIDTLAAESEVVDFYPVGFYNTDYANEVLAHFAAAEANVADDKELLAEIKQEEQYFIEDWMRHPVYRNIDESSREIILQQLDRLRLLTGDSEKERNGLARRVHKLALTVDSSLPGTLKIVEEWIGKQNIFAMHFTRLSNGIRLSPKSFMFAGFGPAKYGYNCPPMDAVGIYVQGNSKHRSHRMAAKFELEDLEKYENANLTLQGQASAIFTFKPRISIRLNGREIYVGPAHFVKHDWSLQKYNLPPDSLRVGENTLEIVNTSEPLSIVRWNQGWVLISEAVIAFE